MNKPVFSVCWLAALSLVSVCCSPRSEQNDAWVYRQPEQVNDGWETASLGAVGVAPGPLRNLMSRLRASPGHLVEGIVIAVHGKLVFEEYFDGRAHPTHGDQPVSYDRLTKHCLSSVTKSVTATLLGMAIDQGFAESADEKLFDFFPDMADLNTGQKSEIILKHMVTMSAGLQWDEWTYPLSDPRNDLTKWFNFEGDLLRFVLERPMVAIPVTMARFLRPFSCHGGSVSSSASRADCSLPSVVSSLRPFPDRIREPL